MLDCFFVTIHYLENIVKYIECFFFRKKKYGCFFFGSGSPFIINCPVVSHFNSDGAHVANKKSKGEEAATSNICSSFFLDLSTTLADQFLLPELLASRF